MRQHIIQITKSFKVYIFNNYGSIFTGVYNSNNEIDSYDGLTNIKYEI